MAMVDIEQIKAQIIAMQKHRHEGSSPGIAPPPTLGQLAANKMLKDLLVNAGLDVAKMDGLLMQSQREARSLAEKQKAAAVSNAAASKKAYQQALAGEREALGQLTNAPAGPAGQSSLIVLDKAIFILQEPSFAVEFPVQLNTGAYDNWVKFNINTPKEGDNTTFVFYFLWENLSGYEAVVNVATPVTLNGVCSIGGAPGFFSGTTGSLQLATQLSPIQYWIQPPVAVPSQPSANQVPFAASVDGGGIFQSDYVSYTSQPFNYQSFQHSYDLFLVPPASVALFEISVAITYSFSDGGGNISEGVTADFLSNEGMISCPFVLLQLLTSPG